MCKYVSLFISHTSSNIQYIIINTLTPRHTSRARVIVIWINVGDEIVLNVLLFSMWVCVRSACLDITTELITKNKYAWWDTAPCLWQIYFKIIRNISIINKYLHTSGITLQTCECLGSNFCLDRNTNNFSLHRLDNQKKEDTCIGNMISLDYIHRIVCQYFMLWRFIIMLLFFNNGPLLIEVLIRGIIIIVWILCYIDFVNYLEKIHTFSVVDISVYILVI